MSRIDKQSFQKGDKIIVVISEGELSHYTARDIPFEQYGFYSGMSLTVKGIGKDGRVMVEEIPLNLDSSVCVLEKEITKEELEAVIKKFQDSFYKENAPFLKFYRNQKVLFTPGKLSQIWFKNKFSDCGLVTGDEYKITDIIENKWLILDNKNFRAYWKDVQR